MRGDDVVLWERVVCDWTSSSRCQQDRKSGEENEGRSKTEWCVVLEDSVFKKGKAKWESEEKFSG